MGTATTVPDATGRQAAAAPGVAATPGRDATPAQPAPGDAPLPARPGRLATVAGVVGLWAGHSLLVFLLAFVLLHSAAARGGHPGIPERFLHGMLPPDQPVPVLFRWDSVWYLEIARDLYAGTRPESPRAIAFLPLFPLAVRGASEVTGWTPIRAATVLPVVVTLGALLAFAGYLRSAEGAAGDALWQPLVALLAWPGAFVLLAPYAESTFLLLALLAFWGARRGRFGWAAGAAFLAGLTRVHAVALAAALAWLAWERRRESGWRGLLPPLSAAAGVGAFLLFVQARFGDARAFWETKNTFLPRLAPWDLPAGLDAHLEWALSRPRLGAVQVVLEPLAAALLLGAAAVLLRLRRAPEAVYLLAGVALSVGGGSFWGLLRYSLQLFPLFVVLARLRARPAAWGLALIASAMLQALLLFQYVHSVPPAP